MPLAHMAGVLKPKCWMDFGGWAVCLASLSTSGGELCSHISSASTVGGSYPAITNMGETPCPATFPRNQILHPPVAWEELQASNLGF